MSELLFKWVSNKNFSWEIKFKDYGYQEKKRLKRTPWFLVSSLCQRTISNQTKKKKNSNQKSFFQWKKHLQDPIKIALCHQTQTIKLSESKATAAKEESKEEIKNKRVSITVVRVEPTKVPSANCLCLK